MNTLINYFLSHEKEKANATFLRQPIGNNWKKYSFQEVGNCARRLASFIKSQNIEEKSNIALLSKNCAEWIIVDLAISFAGCISVPIYHQINKEDLNYILDKSDAKMLFVGKLDSWKDRKEGLNEDLITIRLPHYEGNALVRAKYNYEKIIERYPVLNEVNQPDINDIYSIIFTSGTTFNPKGVMISWRAISKLIERQLIDDDLKLSGGNVKLFSYLPLSNIAERIFVEAFGIFKAAEISFVESSATFQNNLQATQPTHFMAVPRIWEKFKLATLNAISAKKIDRYLKIPLLKNRIKNRIAKEIGLKNARILLTGSAPIAPQTLNWYSKLDMKIQEVYGMTENCGICCLMPKNEVNTNTVGKPINGVELFIEEENNEILVRSDWLMNGYYKDEKANYEVFEDGFFKTGDCGEILANGYLKLNGRVNDLFYTKNEKLINPIPYENNFKDHIFIEQVCVTGRNLSLPIILIELSKIGRKEKNEKVEEEISNLLLNANIGLPKYQKIGKAVIIHDKWNIANGFLSPTFKIKREFVFNYYSNKLLHWVQIENKVIWD